MKCYISIVIVLLVLSCGDSPSGPADPVYPTPSVLAAVFTGCWFPPDTSKGTSNDIQLMWTVCPDSSFWKYTLYRSYTPDIESLPDSAEIIHIIFDTSDTVYTDLHTSWDTRFYYAVRTSDLDTLVSWSNEVFIDIPSQNTFGGPDSLVKTVDVGAGPGGICCLPSGSYVYVACYFGSSVYVLDTSDYSVFTSIPVSGGPTDVCSSSEHVFVSCGSGDEVQAIRTSDNTVEMTVSVADSPAGICVTPDEEYVYVCCYGSDEVWCLDAVSLSVIDVIDVGNGPCDICCLPSGEYIYLTNRLEGSVTVIRVSDNEAVSTWNVASEPTGICSSITGEHVYVCDYSANRVLYIGTFTGTVEASPDVGMSPIGVSVVPNGSIAYVSCYQEDRIYFLDLSSGTAAGYIASDIRPNGICSVPSGEQVYFTNSISSTVSVLGYSGSGWAQRGSNSDNTPPRARNRFHYR